MNDRSPAVTVKPDPTTASAVGTINPVTLAIDIANATPIARNLFDLRTAAASKDFGRAKERACTQDLSRDN